MKEFEDKVAVVTGAASGIGRAMANRFAGEEMKVVLADVEEGALARAEAEMREAGATVLSVVTDVSKGADVERLAQETLDAFGAVHVVCNNAGVTDQGGPIWQKTLSDWEWVMGVNLWGVIHGVRVFVPIMLEQGDEGHIVNTASMAGLMSGGGNTYGVTKHGVVSLSESLYLELQTAGAKVSASVLCPGWVSTDIIDAERNRPPQLENPAQEPDQTLTEMREVVRGLLASGLSPDVVADHVFNAIRDDHFYILTHPEMTPMIENRMKNILEGRNPTGFQLR
ncbi:MAG: SDR family NAD(P)-dependent oxidoreductase [Chloroflexi bacterium]|nr:SDR family NAD(P)-dependent oxidoreductase [Chloroflexota bacterium]